MKNYLRKLANVYRSALDLLQDESERLFPYLTPSESSVFIMTDMDSFDEEAHHIHPIQFLSREKMEVGLCVV